MDFNPKQQWRRDECEEEEEETSPKQPRLLQPPPALPLFLHQPSSSAKMGSYFSVGQWQELELQALIFRHMIAGAAVPPDLLHLVKKSLIASHYQYYPQSLGYWGKGAMDPDPEPGRCRRTDGKKWRCSRDVVAGQKYCERHMHRGRNRSRKPVEISTSIDLHLNPSPRPLESINESQNDGGRTLRRFFDDWPPTDNATITNLSISTDFSLKLGTGNSDHTPQLNWGIGGGGPLAEALRSSISTSSPTSVLHRLPTTSASQNT